MLLSGALRNDSSSKPRRGTRALGLAYACLLIACIGGLWGCRSDISVNGQSVSGNLKKLDEDPAPAVGAVETSPTATETNAPATTTDTEATDADPSATAAVLDIPEGLSIDRTYVQSRTPIALRISQGLATLGDAFSLYNDSTGQTLVTQEVVALYEPASAYQAPPIALWLESEAALMADDLTLMLYPLDSELRGKLAYGANHLRFVAGEASSSPRRSERLLQRRDFYVATVSRAVFKGSLQRQNGFEAELGLWHQPVVTTGKTTLTLGVIPLLSR
jgi:hypothetical protein